MAYRVSRMESPRLGNGGNPSQLVSAAGNDTKILFVGQQYLQYSLVQRKNCTPYIPFSISSYCFPCI